jgi:hypothetical protein
MDLRVYARVLWRFKFLVGCGLLLGLALALLATVRVQVDGGRPAFAYREAEVWESQTTVFVTQRGFPWGRTVFDEVVPVEQQEALQELDPTTPGAGFVPRFADPGRFQALAVLYAQLVESDQVLAMVARKGPIRGTFEAAPVPSDDGGSILPFVRITATSDSPAHAVQLARRATAAFRQFLNRQQAEGGIQPEKRIEVPVIRDAEGATLFQGRSINKPMFLFMLVLVLTVGLAFLLENLRPRIRPVPAEDVAPAERREAARRSA